MRFCMIFAWLCMRWMQWVPSSVISEPRGNRFFEQGGVAADCGQRGFDVVGCDGHEFLADFFDAVFFRAAVP